MDDAERYWLIPLPPRLFVIGWLYGVVFGLMIGISIGIWAWF